MNQAGAAAFAAERQIVIPTGLPAMDLNAFEAASPFDWVGLDDTGFFQQGSPETRVKWADVLKIALVFVPDPFAGEDFVWAIQSDRGLTLVSIENPVFEAAIRAHFNVPEVPLPAEWEDPHEPRSYVVWPEIEMGRALNVEPFVESAG